MINEFGLNENQIRDLYFASLLKDAGCSSNVFRIYKIFNSNDLVTKYNVKISDWSNKIESIKFAIKNVKKNNIIEKLFHLYKETGLSPSIMDDLTLARCTRGAEIAKYIGFSEEVAKAIEHLDEHWDGNGSPYKLKGQKIPLFSRIICLSQTMDVFISSVNLEEAYNIIQKRKGKWFDPELVKAAISFKNEIDFWKNYYQIIENPNPQNLLETQEELTIENFDKICEGFSLIVDAKSPYTYQHSTRVAQYSQLIAKEIGYTNLQFIKIAGLLHDIGKPGIPYLAHIASAHHEKLNAKGYHRNLKNE